jgi:succinate dehydrogenase / fumarate reductase cytochrome b subunit
VRHLIWDTISGFEIWQVDALCWGTIIGSVVLTIALWAGAFALHGWL